VNGSLKFLAQPAGRHASAGTAPLRRWQVGGIAGTLAAAATAVVLVISSGGQAPHAPQAAASVSAAAVGREIARLTPQERQEVGIDLSQAFAKAGMLAGTGNPERPYAGEAHLTSYTWSGGANLTDAWVTASDANLKPFVDQVNGIANAITRADVLFGFIGATVCGAIGFIPVVGAVAGATCGLLAWALAVSAANVYGPFPGLSNHGIWEAFYYWSSPHLTGGSW
jgi:hypothetical protein